MMGTGESNLNVIAVQASVHLPYDRNLLVQNLSSQVIWVHLVLHALFYVLNLLIDPANCP